ncbi:MAG: hypothetical protein PHN88_01405 [Ignavibacteria bacterium]|nr:hypothetical protein [Ignavibacteria bacterium]
MFSLNFGPDFLIPPDETNLSKKIGYGISLEFQYIRNNTLTWFAGFDINYYQERNDLYAMYPGEYPEGYESKVWLAFILGAKIYPDKDLFGLHFILGAGAINEYVGALDFGLGYEIKINDRISANPFAKTHIILGAGGESIGILYLKSMHFGCTLNYNF